jgi:hypothetical protein
VEKSVIQVKNTDGAADHFFGEEVMTNYMLASS